MRTLCLDKLVPFPKILLLEWICFMESWREINLATFALGEKGKSIRFSYLEEKTPKLHFSHNANSSRILKVCILPKPLQWGVPKRAGQPRGRDVEEEEETWGWAFWHCLLATNVINQEKKRREEETVEPINKPLQAQVEHFPTSSIVTSSVYIPTYLCISHMFQRTGCSTWMQVSNLPASHIEK